MSVGKPLVLVTGATGAQGGAVVSELLKSKRVSIRGVTRNPSSAKAQQLASQGVQMVKADLFDASSLASALNGVERAFLVTDYTGPRGTDGEVEQGRLFLKAAEQQGLRHLVFSSVGDANNHTGVPHFESKFQIEQSLKASSIPSWTILRPVAFMDNLPVEPSMQRAMTLGIFGSMLAGKRLKMIAVSDIGWFAARALEEPEKWNRTELALAGDELTIEGIKNAYKNVQGSKPRTVWMPRSAWNAMLPKEVKIMFQFFREKGYDAEIPVLRKMNPGLLTFEQWLRTQNKSK